MRLPSVWRITPGCAILVTLALLAAGPMRAQGGPPLTEENLAKLIELQIEDDTIAAKLKTIADSAGPVADRLAPALLEVNSIFGTLGADPRLRSAVTQALAKLYEAGTRQAVQEFCSA